MGGWRGGSAVFGGPWAQFSPVFACGAQASPAARYFTPLSHALAHGRPARRGGDGGAPQTVMAVCTAIPVHQGCSVRCWEGVDRLRRLHRREVGATANLGTD